jgi:hypothetical protein
MECRAPFSFFSTTDIGITLNRYVYCCSHAGQCAKLNFRRFSQDMSLVDQALPMAAFTTIFGENLRRSQAWMR